MIKYICDRCGYGTVRDDELQELSIYGYCDKQTGYFCKRCHPIHGANLVELLRQKRDNPTSDTSGGNNNSSQDKT